ncbi:unnamed protein product, partial [Clavelina lepadiformis]
MQIINNNERIGSYQFRHGRQNLVVESALISDNGIYTCVVSNKYGSINRTYELEVIECTPHQPVGLLQFGLLVNKTATVGEAVEFECKVQSDPHPNI